MAMKDFDIKQFLLEKGERVGLYAAGGVALLMILLSLFYPGKGLFSASPKATADDINKVALQKKTLVQTAKPDAAQEKELVWVDPQLKKQATNVPQDPDAFRLPGEVFAARDPQSNKRRKPSIYAPEEFLAAVAHSQVNSYLMLTERDGTLTFGVRVVSNKTTKPGTKPFDPLQGLKGMYGPGSGGKGMPMGPPGGFPGMPGGYDPRRVMGGGPTGPGEKPGAFGDDTKKEIRWVKQDELDKIAKEDYARELRPVRVAIVAGSFPYKAQVEEFKKALRLDSPYRVLQESVTGKDKKGNDIVQPAFRFVGFNVRRRAYGPDGKLIPAKESDPAGWQALDIESPASPYRAIAANVLREFAPEAPRVQPLAAPGLVMPRPVQVLNKPYPEIEEQLPGIKKTLEALEGAEKGKAPAVVSNPLKDAESFDPFGGAPAAAPTGPDGGPVVGPGGSGFFVPPKGYPGDGRTGPGPAEAAGVNQEWAPPDYCLMRFLDVTVEPGHTYEYQVRVRMANPNYNKPESEVAYKQLTKEPELLSDWVDVKGPDGKLLRVSVPEELFYYAVDEEALTKEKLAAEKGPKKPARDKDKEYKGMNAGVKPKAGQAVVQAHRWVDFYDQIRAEKTTDTFLVGDWVIAERMFVWRGEYLGQKTPVHLPRWSKEQNTFILAGRPPRSGSDKRPVEEVSFDTTPTRAPLLVDFEGGAVTYHRPGAAPPKTEDGNPVEGGKATPGAEVKATAATELLLLTPDGKLLARNSATDEADEERDKREKDYTDRVKDADGGSKPAEAGKPGPFDKPGGPGTGDGRNPP